MLRAASGNSNEITFRLNLETDPRYRSALKSFSKDITEAQTSVFETIRSTTARVTSAVQGATTTAARTHKSSMDAMVRDTEKMLDRLESRLDRIQKSRIVGNVLASANARAGARNAQADYWRNRAPTVENLAMRDIAESQSARSNSARTYSERMGGGEINLLTANSRLSEGFQQTAGGIMSMVRAMAIFGLSSEQNLERAIRKLAAVEAAVHSVSGLLNIGRGVMNISSGISAGAYGVGALKGLGIGGLMTGGLAAGAVGLAGAGMGILANGLLTMPTAADREREARRISAGMSRMEMGNIESMRAAYGGDSSMRVGDIGFDANMLTARGNSARMDVVRQYRSQVGAGIFGSRNELGRAGRFDGMSDAYASAEREAIGARLLSLRERDLDLVREERNITEAMLREREQAGQRDVRAALQVLDAAKQSLEIAVRRKGIADEQYGSAAAAFGGASRGQRLMADAALRRFQAGESITPDQEDLLAKFGLGDMSRQSAIRRGEQAGFAGSGIGQFLGDRRAQAASGVTVAQGVVGAAGSALEFVSQLNAGFAEQLRAKLKERDEAILEAAGRLAAEVSAQQLRKWAADANAEQLAKNAVESQSG